MASAQRARIRGVGAAAAGRVRDARCRGRRYDGSRLVPGSALGLSAELGMRPLVAHCHAGLAKLYRRTGNRQEAAEHLMAATTMYREMDMRFYLEQAGAELKELS